MKIYRVEIVEPLSEEGDSYEFSNPEKTIKTWFELGEKYPMCVGIFAKTQNDAKALIECASKMDIMALCKEHKCHYLPEYLIDGIQRGLSNSRLISWEYDSVFPFTFG